MVVEAVSSESFRQEYLDQGVAIKAEQLVKNYEMGTEKVHALRGVDLVIHRG